MAEIAIISWNEKGFWQGDYWQDAGPDELLLTGQSCDGWFTCAKDSTPDYAEQTARRRWPNAKVYVLENDDDDDDDQRGYTYRGS